jgi:hypothetical protein
MVVRLTIAVAIWSLWPVTCSVWPVRPEDGPPAREARSAG